MRINGKKYRTIWYEDDVVKIMFQLINKKPEANDQLTQNYGDPSRSWAPFRIFNIGNGTSIPLLDFISLLEKELGIKAIKEFKEMQLGDVQKTFADIESIKSNINIKPKTSLEEGLKKFVNWYKEFYIN